MNFNLTEEQLKKLDDWMEDTVYPETIRIQKEKIKNPGIEYKISWDCGYPYEGAIGGGLQYIFIPTSIGVIAKAQYKTYDMDVEIDLTDYNNF